MGYRCRLGENCHAASGIGISNTPQSCGQELTEMYCDEKSDILISCGGGELMCEILEYVDFEKLAAAKPKWFMGYSDNTHFTFLQTTLCDTAAVYGPCAATFGMEQWHTALFDAMDVLTGTRLALDGYDGWESESVKSVENPTASWNITNKSVLRCYLGKKETDTNVSELRFGGRLIGGCMDCLVNLLGTRYDAVQAFNKRYEGDGIVWFLESCDLNVFAIRRAMWQMENAGWFQNVKGFLIGRPYVFGQELMGLNQYAAVTEIAGKYNVPIVMDCDIGHLAPTMPLIGGSIADIRVAGGHITVSMRLA